MTVSVQSAFLRTLHEHQVTAQVLNNYSTTLNDDGLAEEEDVSVLSPQ